MEERRREEEERRREEERQREQEEEERRREAEARRRTRAEERQLQAPPAALLLLAPVLGPGRAGAQIPRGLPAPAPPDEAPQTTVDNLRLAMAAEHVYEPVNALALALQAQMASFAPWRRQDPPCKPVDSGWV